MDSILSKKKNAVQNNGSTDLIVNNADLDSIFVPESQVQQHATNPVLAVHIENGFKSYGKFHVLKSLNLNVKKGSIYGLLGPSGCGKTTILRTIVGRLVLDSGLVKVFGKVPGTKESNIPGRLVGYMPQEVALYNDFTIKEILYYFGLNYKMKIAEIKQRRDFLIEFLDLPPKEKSIKNLSGGQKRRVSMAIALLQEPELLILDEPTVGVDPLLREKIWNHLIDISKVSHTTIIITTHYIEEARKADQVGLIRSGRILAEHPPDYLLELHNETSLENVFLKLCVKDQTNNKTSSPQLANLAINNINTDVNDTNEANSRLSAIKYKIKQGISKTVQLPKWNSYLSILYKESILIRRNIGFLIFQFLIPIIQMSLFCLCIGREPYNLKFGIVNNETIFNSTTDGALIYVNSLSNETFDKQYMNWSEAYTKTRNNELWGFIDLYANFTLETRKKYSPLSFLNTTFPGSNVNIYLDASNQLISNVIKARALEAYQTFLVQFLAKYEPLFPRKILDSPVIFQTPIYGSQEPEFINFMAPGIMVTIMFTLSIGLTALMFVMEKKEGLLDRSLVAGVSTIEIMLAHVSAKLLIMIVQIGLLIIIANFVFEITMNGPLLITSILLLLQGYCGMSFGLAISAGSNDETEVIQLSIGSIFPLLLMSGIVWPVEGMPIWVRYITNASPLTHAAEAMRSVASRGWNLTYTAVWLGVVVTLGWSLIFDIIALFLFNLSQ